MAEQHRPSTAHSETRIAPHLVKVCQAIEALFRRHVGPIGTELYEETLNRVTGNRHLTSSRGLAVLLHHLSVHIPESGARPRFLAEADQLLQHFLIPPRS